MSEYIRWLNLIKEKSTPEWLTESQRNSAKGLEHLWKSERCGVLVGDAGVGKSFIGRLLSQSEGGLYAAGLAELTASDCEGKYIVLDLGASGVYTRALRLVMEEMNMGRLLVLTRQLPRDLVRTVRLELTERDVQQFRHNMVAHGVIEAFCTEPTGCDLAEDLRREALGRASRSSVDGAFEHRDGLDHSRDE
jgi:hypothetical protein